ncbi:acyl-CoA-binding domain-containing protein 7 isoform X1 [Papio anubis]|uniref:acyl-CoA-binding domain-containing protein 7 isoform X1 n=1 Tax=Papio anubis TaxID=9555 RepID=UPI00083E985A|nr:acyl-CoA-binding domain-containing protein 7 isoform X1 [Papio anubis]
MALQADFDRAAEDVRKLKARPDDGELKELYGLYKQAIIGDINIVLEARSLKWVLFGKNKVWFLLESLARESVILSFPDSKGFLLSPAWRLPLITQTFAFMITSLSLTLTHPVPF